MTKSGFGKLAKVMVVSYAVIFATSVRADPDEDLASYCFRTAGEHCFATQGYDSQECQDAYMEACARQGPGHNGPQQPVGEGCISYGEPIYGPCN